MLAGLAAASLLGVPGRAAAEPLIVEYGATSIASDAKPTDVVAGPDGNLWYTFPGRDAIARVAPSGAVLEVTAGISSDAAPQSITVGPDGNLWFTEPGRDRVATYSFATGQVTEYGSGITAGARPWDIVSAGGALWFTENGAGKIGRSSVNGSIAELTPALPAGAQPWGIAADGVGNLWFPYSTPTSAAVVSMEQDGDIACTTATLVARFVAIGQDGAPYVDDAGTGGIDRISGDCQTISVFTGSQPVHVSGLTLGPDSNIWFTDTETPSIGRLNLTGSGEELELYSGGLYPGSLPTGIAADPAGERLWIGDVGPRSAIGQVSTFGAIAQLGFGTLPAGAAPQQITPGNGWMYFTETGASRVGAIAVEDPPLGQIVDTGDGISSGSAPYGIVWDDQTGTGLWITQQGDRVAHSAGVVGSSLAAFTETSQGITPGSQPWDLTFYESAPWFTERAGGRYAFVDPVLPNFFVQQEFSLPAGSEPEGIVEAAGGYLWIADPANERVFQLTSGGLQPVPTTGYAPSELAAGPDGNLWFTAPADNAVGRITAEGQVTVFQAGISPNAQPTGITAGPGDGALWFTEPGLDQVARIVPPSGSSTSAQVTEFGGLTAGSEPAGIAAYAENTVWFTEPGGDRIGAALLGPPELDPDSSSLAFPDTPTNGQSQQTLTITNTGDMPLEVGGLSIFPSGVDFFEVPPATDECSNETILAEDSCTIVVVFEPTVAGALSAWVQIPSNAPTPTAMVPLSGEGIFPPTFFVSPLSRDFGGVPIGQTAGPLAFAVTNLGQEPFSIGTPQVEGTGFSAFTIVPGPDDCTGQALSQDETCSLRVAFTPDAPGPVMATLDFNDDAPGGPHTAPLSGVGLAPGFEVSPSAGLFGPQRVGTASAGQTFTVTNPGGAALTLGTLAVGGANAQSFALSADTCSGETLAAGTGSCIVQVTFEPTGAGPRTGLLAFNDDAPGGPHTLTLSGTGVVPAFAVQPSGASFGLVGAGTATAPQTFTVSNPGSAPLTLGTLALSGEDPEDFRLSDDACSGQELAPETGSCSFGVAFVPTAVGTRAALVSFGDDAPGGPHVLPVSGSGGAPPLPPQPPAPPTPTPPERPALTGLRLTPAAFTPFARGGTFAARTGSLLSFRLSQRATVTFSVRRYVRGRRRGRDCLPTRARVPRAERCRALVAAGRPFVRRRLPAGANRFTFTGRPGGKSLRPDDYRLYATPRNSTGGTGATASVRFELLMRPRRP